MIVNNYFANNSDLFSDAIASVELVKPWKPHALGHDQWPPNYVACYAWRLETLAKLRNDEALLASAKAYYANHPSQFIQHWMDTYNPRKQDNKWIPFIFFARQDQFVEFLLELDRDQQNGLVEKCRDIGATWLLCAYSVWCFLFKDGDATGWGSRKQELVDKIGDADSIFEKMRLILRRLPDIWLPQGFNARTDATFMKLLNPATGGSITGESGDNIGRGGRKSRYAKDESAHYERAELVQAALDDNTNVQIDISSVNGLGNVFHRKREAGIDWRPNAPPIEKGFTRVFIFDWRDHPEKTQEWYDRRKAAAEREGMQHKFAQEVDRNYSAAVQNTIINYEWITAAIDAHKKIPYLASHVIPDIWSAGLDVADEGVDRNALALRQWIILRDVEEWGSRDPGVTARRAMIRCRQYRGIKVQYDSIGMGTNIKSEYNRLVDEGSINPQQLQMIPWNAGAEVLNKFERVIPDDDESVLNKDFFGNMKAQAWWSIRTRFYKTWRAITCGDVYSPDELISLDGSMPLLLQAAKELATPTQGPGAALRMIVEKRPNGTRSPNLADAIVQAFFPAVETVHAIVGNYGG